MSHFTVLVIGSHPENQLAPYQENNMGDCPEEFLAFHDIEDEYQEQYKTDTCRKVIMPDGRLLDPWNEEFRIPGTFGTGSSTHRVPSHLSEMEYTMNQLYRTFEQYMADWCGYKKRDSKKGRYGYWENPNAKWDWYLLGGRWTGFFKLKHPAVGITGKPGIMTEPASPGFADQALKRDIDFEYMFNKAAKDAAKKYDLFASKVDASISHESWESVRNRIQDYEQAREFYSCQPQVIQFKKAQEERKFRDSFGIFESVEEFHVSRDQYIQIARDRAISTFAIVKDGNWYEKGKMGWWASVSDEKDPSEWHRQVTQLINECHDETLFSLYDCHI